MRASELLPNALSLSRLGMAAALWVFPDNLRWLLGWMVAAGISDLLDGWLARRLRSADPSTPARAEETGAWLDPLCDKAFVLSLLALLLSTGVIDVPALALLAVREFLVVPMVIVAHLLPAMRHVRFRYKARVLGKLTTVAQFACVAAFLLEPRWGRPLAWVAAAVGAAAGVDYALRAYRNWREAPR